MKVIIIMVIILGFGIYYLFTNSKIGEKKPGSQRSVQEFMNVIDIDSFIYTRDHYLIGFLKVSGRKTDLLSDREKYSLTQQMTADVSTCSFPFQILAAPQPEDNSALIYQYQEMLNTTNPNPIRKKLLREAIHYQNELMLSGENMERQIYVKVWEYQKDGAEQDLSEKLQQLARCFDISGYSVELLKKEDVIKLNNLIHNPRAVIYESDSIDTGILPGLEVFQ